MPQKHQTRGSVSLSAEGMIHLDKLRKHEAWSSVQWHADATPGSRSAVVEAWLRQECERLGIEVGEHEVQAWIDARASKRAKAEPAPDPGFTSSHDAFGPRYTG